MQTEKPYRISVVTCTRKEGVNRLNIWVCLTNNATKSLVRIKGVTILNNECQPVDYLTFKDGSHTFLQSIGGSIKKKEYCYPLYLTEKEYSNLIRSPCIKFFVEIMDKTYTEKSVVIVKSAINEE